ncbi:MAG: DMT family transporter [Crocinitomicaceae bacterium]|nr:DMT family transporter [Crocinitomicaceae bacterium]
MKTVEINSAVFFYSMLSKFKYQILLHLIIIMWGFTGILGKLIHLEAFIIVWYRVFIAFIALGIGMFILRKPFKVRSRKQLLKIAFVGILVGLHWITFYMSIQLSTASLGILCLSTTTVHVAWLEPIIMKRRISWLEIILSLIVVYGIYFVSGDFNANETKALVYGLISAFFAAAFAVSNTKLAEDSTPAQISLYEMVSAFIFITIVLLFQGRIDLTILKMSQSDFLWLLFLGILCTSFAFLAIIEIMKKLGAFTVSLSINLEPVYTILLAIFILKENELLGTNFYVGSIIIIAVVVANAVIKSIEKRRLKKAGNQVITS